MQLNFFDLNLLYEFNKEEKYVAFKLGKNYLVYVKAVDNFVKDTTS